VSNATLFVRFKNEDLAEDNGFKSEHSYPVYQVRDVEEGDDLLTEFLLANNDGELSWLPMREFKRSKPAPSGGNRGRDNRRDRGGARRQGPPRGNRRDDPNPYGGAQDSILGGRDFDD
jgi:hypothetical protein